MKFSPQFNRPSKFVGLHVTRSTINVLKRTFSPNNVTGRFERSRSRWLLQPNMIVALACTECKQINLLLFFLSCARPYSYFLFYLYSLSNCRALSFLSLNYSLDHVLHFDCNTISPFPSLLRWWLQPSGWSSVNWRQWKGISVVGSGKINRETTELEYDSFRVFHDKHGRVIR